MTPVPMPKLPNPYVLADQIIDLRREMDLCSHNREAYKATQVVIDWLESIALTPQMAGASQSAPASLWKESGI